MVLTLEPGLGLGDFSEFNKAPAGFKDFIKHLILDFSCLEIFGLLRFTPFLLRGFAVPVKKL